MAPKITEKVTNEISVTIDRDYCLAQAALCLLGRSSVGFSPYLVPGSDGRIVGPLEGAEAWRLLAAEFG